jgi:CRP-like cAMP-binding protein
MSTHAPDTVLLQRVALFHGLSAAALDDLATGARRRTIGPSEHFFREGDRAESFFVIDTGSVKLMQLSPEGHQVVLRLLGPGDVFGGVAAWGGVAYPVTAEAITDVAAFEWAGTDMANLMERYPPLAMNALRLVSGRLHELQEQYRQLATERVERRIARALVRLVQQAGRRIDAGVLIDLPLSRDDLAQMTGTTLYTVSRVVSRWEHEKILEAGRQRLVIKQPHALATIADDLT